MKRRNPRGPLYGLAGLAAAVILCLSAMALVPAVMDSAPASMNDARVTRPASSAPAVSQAAFRDTATPAAPAPAPAALVTTPAAPPVTPAVPAAPARVPATFPLLAQLTAAPDCTLAVPANPLTAAGLATPYVLANAGQQTCTENNPNLAAFVQAVILDPATGTVTAYDPVVGDAGQPAAAPAPPVLPPHAVVTIWTGFNGNVLKLTGAGAGQFVNFAQQSYANSPLFFAALRFSVARGLTKVPALGTSAADGMACPTVRDFSVVDQDQSDNVPVSYGAPFNVSNGSDDDLLTLIDNALGCTPWQVTLQDPGVTASGAAMTTAGPLEEVQAALMQGAPRALVPGLDPFVTVNAMPNILLQNLYRLQVGQPLTFNDQDTTAYCKNLAAVGAPRLAKDAAAEAMAPAPAFAMIGTSLATVLANRFAATWVNLTCPALTGMPSPITVDNPNFATTASLNGTQYTGAVPAAAAATPAAAATTPAPDTATTAPATDTATAPAPDTTTPADTGSPTAPVPSGS